MKQHNITLSLALAAVFSSSVALSEAEVTGKIVHESAQFTESGTTIGAASAHGKDTFKTETAARIYIDGDLDGVREGATYHMELQAFTDGEGIGKHDSNESYTQRDALREAYIDTEYEDWSIRAGKQQVVWGTADGMKLLDMINPTDYSEMAQNQMEDSRIPVWMLNAEKELEDGSNVQVVLSQPKENVFAGLDRSIDTSVRTSSTNKAHNQGHAFIMKGVDSMTGKENGFLAIAPDMGAIASGFYSIFGANLKATTNHNVAGFVTYNAATVAAMGIGGGADGAATLYNYGAGQDTNLDNASTSAAFDTSNPDSMFEYMGNTTFATFDSFAGITSQWKYEMPSDSDVDLALRYKNSTTDGLNYSLNASYNYDKNPIVDLTWRNSSGELLKVNDVNSNGTKFTLTSLDGNTAYGGDAGQYGVLTFEQKVKRATNLGGSFDMAIETEELGPVVIRGEALYQKDVYSPVMDKTQLSFGNLTSALTMQKGDRFKYVLGADITALTNMMVSLQFIQDRNLDFIDTTSTIGSTTMARYTSDYATMHMTNGFNKAEENKEFYSLFLSKPFGASGEHRWNNIFMFEENGGKWNRLDAEFSIDDDTQVTAEYNKYWGDANTQFGQLEASSNVQIGFKYSF